MFAGRTCVAVNQKIWGGRGFVLNNRDQQEAAATCVAWASEEAPVHFCVVGHHAAGTTLHIAYHALALSSEGFMAEGLPS